MPTVLEIIRRLLPRGTNGGNPGGEDAWDEFPLWPPDLFAVAATLVDRSGCYAHPRVIGDWGAPLFDGVYLATAKRLGLDWKGIFQDVPRANEWDPIREVGEIQDLWKELLHLAKVPIRDPDPDTYPEFQAWWGIAIRLMAIADEASAGIGFPLDDEAESPDPIVVLYVSLVYNYLSTRGRSTASARSSDDDPLPYLPASL